MEGRRACSPYLHLRENKPPGLRSELRAPGMPRVYLLHIISDTRNVSETQVNRVYSRNSKVPTFYC